MSLHRPVSSALALTLMLPLFGVATADAAFIRRSVIKTVTNSCGSCSTYRVATTVGSSIPFYTVVVEAVSPAGEEDVPLEETDAWLHGTAALPALPTTDATVSLTLYDTASAELMSFSGVLATDGSVTLAADKTWSGGGDPACTSRTGCDTTDTSATPLDIEVLATELFGGTRGYDLGIDLAGADTDQVAYASLSVTERGGTATRAEVGWDEIGSVWEGDLTLAHDGLVELKVRAWDADGEKVDAAKSKVGMPWIDGGEGVSVLATDDDPLTTVALRPRSPFQQGITLRVVKNSLLTVASSGWSAAEAPVDAQVELTDGGTITIPVNSYHRRATGYHLVYTNELRSGGLAPDSRVVITGGSVVFADDSLSTLTDSPMCVSGGCFRLEEDADGNYALSVSAYGLVAADLPDDLDLTVTFTDARGAELATEDLLVAFEDDITAVFANEVGFSEDPTGLDLSGKVSLLGAANRKGKQSTLSKGKFNGSISRDGDGDLGLGGADKDTVAPRGDAVVVGDPLAFELTRDTNDDGVLTPPPLAPLAAEGDPVRYYTIELEAIVITHL